MRRALILIAALAVTSCSGSSTAPSPTPSTPPPVVTSPAPATPPLPTRGPEFDQTFWNQFVHGALDSPIGTHPLARLAAAPTLYIRTVDEAGRVIDLATLDTVQNAMQAVASTWGGGQFGLAGVQRGTDTKARQHGWLTVRWLGTNAGNFCGQSDVGADGGIIDLNYLIAGGVCGCNGSKVRPRTASHELGHAFGYEHTDSTTDVMSGLPAAGCDVPPSAREIYHATIAYQSPVGTTTALARASIID